MADVYAMKNILLDGIIAELQVALQDEIDPEDPTYVTTVREGRLQDDPGRGTGLNVLVWTEDDEPAQGDELWTRETAEGLHSPIYEIGGGAYYMMRWRIYLIFHFAGLTGDEGRETARTRAWIVTHRILHRLFTMPIPTHPITGQPKDDFGNVAIDIQIPTWFLRESGGSGRYIWKGWIHGGHLVEFPTRFNAP